MPARQDKRTRDVGAEYWEAHRGGIRLVAFACQSCGQTFLPRVAVCSRCEGEIFERRALDDNGTVYAWTTSHVAAEGYPSEFSVAYVDYPCGVRVFGPIAPVPEALRIGAAVRVEEAVLRQLPDGTDLRSYRFVPAGPEFRP